MRQARDSATSGRGLVLVFNAPMPPEVIEKYNDAIKTHLFSDFVVASPMRDLFRSITLRQPASSLFLEPVLVGFIGKDSMKLSQSYSVWSGGYIFSPQPE